MAPIVEDDIEPILIIAFFLIGFICGVVFSKMGDK
jgi:hypothetical protein